MESIYETKRLLLKILNKHDKELVFDYYLRNKDFLLDWVPSRELEFYTLNYHKHMLATEYKAFVDKEHIRFWVFRKDNPNQIIGTICFSQIVYGAFQSCYLGYSLSKGNERQGYMSEAIKKGMKIIFDELKIHRIEANVMPKNTASLKVLDQLGFQNEGLANKYLKINGKWEDHIHMVILNDSMEALNE